MSSSFARSAVYISGETSRKCPFLDLSPVEDTLLILTCNSLPVEDTLLILTQVSQGFQKCLGGRWRRHCHAFFMRRFPHKESPSFLPSSFLPSSRSAKSFSTYCVPGIESVNDMILQLHLITEIRCAPRQSKHN